MPRKAVVTKRASYFEGVNWIAANDNVGDDDPRKDGRDGNLQAATRAAIAGYISTCLLADLFGADADKVAHDVYRARSRYLKAGN